MQCGTSHLQTVQENILSRIILATYRKFTVATDHVIWCNGSIGVIGKKGNVLFNDALNTFYLGLYGKGPLSERGNPLPPHGLRLAARVILYASSHRQDNTYHGLCYTSRGALAGTRNSSMGPP